MVAQAKAKYAGNAGSAIKPKEGRNVYRILAPTPDIAPWVGENGQFWADLGVHWIKAEPNGKPIAVVGDCDICYQQPSVLNAAIEMAISKALDEDSKKLYQEWRARKSVLINVIDRSTGTEEILELTPTTFGKILDLIEMYANEDVDILDPQTGCDIIITRTGKGLNTNYEVAVAPLAPGKKFEPVTKEQLARAKNLHEFIAQNYFRGEEQKALNAIAQIAKGAKTTDQQTLQDVLRVQALLRPPIADIEATFTALDAQTASIATILGKPAAQIELVRRVRDDIRFRLRIWDDLVAKWQDRSGGDCSQSLESLVKETYRFAAFHFPQTRDWRRG